MSGSLVATTAGSTVNLAWPAATDAVGAVAYTITRSPPFPAPVVTSGLTYADTAASGSPTYSVTATDARGLTSHPAIGAGVALGSASELPPFNAATPTKYVATSGNYLGNPAFTTFAAANAAAVPGDVIAVAPGSYAITAVITTSGTALNPITWRAADPLNKPVIDGQNARPVGWNESGGVTGSASLVSIAASHVVWDSIDIANSRGFGMVTGPANNNGSFLDDVNQWFTNVTVLRTNIIAMDGVSFRTMNVDGCYIGGCTILDAQRPYYRADGFPEDNPTWGMAVSLMGRNVTMVECTVGQSSGEGIHAGHHISFNKITDPVRDAFIQVENLVLRNCVVFDCWSAPLYVSNVDGGVIERCLFYMSSDTRYWQYAAAGYPRFCVDFGSESGVFGNPTPPNGLIGSRNLAFRNNVMTGALECLVFTQWAGQQFSNIAIENNTIFRSVAGSFPAGATCLRNDHTNLTNLTFRNNLIFDANGRVCDRWNAMLGTNTISHNLWSHAPPANISGSSQIVTTSPGLNNGTYGVTNVFPAVPTFNTDAFRITGASAANNTGVAIPAVTVDYFGNARTTPDIGAHTVT